MWMDEKMAALKERISGLSNEELLNIVEVEFRDYRKEAINFAKKELIRRGIGFEEPDKEKELPSEKIFNVYGKPSRAKTCRRCGGKARPGVLFENQEVTVIFTDRDEQRFLEAYACRQCGHIQIIVDLESEVESYRGEVRMKGVNAKGSAAQHRCPYCGLEPDPAEEWCCDKCGCHWHTFQTHGRCPKCNYQWTETQCNTCGVMTNHEDWYVKARQGE